MPQDNRAGQRPPASPLLLNLLGRGAEYSGRKHGDLTMVRQGREMQAEAEMLLRVRSPHQPSHLKPDND
jgi:hypothetical protein